MRDHQATAPKPPIPSVRERAQTAQCVSATTDVILAAGPSLVALAAIGANVWQQRRGFGHKCEMRDLADTRDLLDQASAALSETSQALSGLERGLFKDGAFVSQRSPERLIDAEHAGERLRLMRGHLAVRLKVDHPALVTFAKAHDATWEAIRAAFALAPSHETNPGETWETVRTAHGRLVDATDEFMRASVASVGAQLPGD